MELNKKKRYILILIIAIIAIMSLGTYAWLSYRTNDTAMVLTIGDINNVRVTLNPYQVNAKISPNLTYTGQQYTTIEVINNSSTPRNIKLYYIINAIDSELATTNLKYTIEKKAVGSSSYQAITPYGNFNGAQKGDEITILEEAAPVGTTLYKVYVWLEGSNSGQSNVTGKTFNAELNATIGDNQYLVMFDADGGDVSIDSKVVEYGSTYGLLPEPTRTGYTFLGWSLVPSEYQQVEYLESTGTQHIDTGYYWKHENIDVYLDGTVVTNASNQSLFGNEEYTNASGTNRNFAGIPHGSNGNYSIYIGNGAQGSVALSLGTRFTLNIVTSTNKELNVYKNGQLSLNKTYDGSVLTKQNAYLSDNISTTVGNVFIFSNHNSNRGTSNGAIQNVSKMRVYAFKMSDNNVLVRDMVPCYRRNGGTRGLYDIVNGVFYENAGSGTFNIGTANYITNTVTVNTKANHTLTAVWQKNTQ